MALTASAGAGWWALTAGTAEGGVSAAPAVEAGLARTKTGPALLSCVGFPVPSQKGFIDDRYREFRP